MSVKMSINQDICAFNFAEPTQSRKKSHKWTILGVSMVTLLVVAGVSVYFSGILNFRHQSKDVFNTSSVAVEQATLTTRATNRPTNRPTDPSDLLTTLTDASDPSTDPNDPLTDEPTLGQPLSKETKKVLDELSSNINSFVDPCEDFYEYACGSFRQKYSLFKNKSDVNYNTLHEDEVRRVLIDRLKGNELMSNSTIAPFKYLKSIWDSCVDEKSDTNSQLPKLMRYLEQLDDLDSWESKFGNLTKNGYNILFTVKSTIHPNGYLNFLIGPPEFELTGGSSDSPPLLDYVSGLIRLLKRDIEDEEEIVELAKEVIEFEQQLSTLATPATKRSKDHLNSYIKEDELDQLTGMNWTGLIASIFEEMGRTREDFTFSHKDDFVETMTDDVEYIKNFKQVIDGKDEYFLGEYLDVAVLHQSCFFMGQECRDLHLKMMQSITKNLDRKEHEKETCFNFLWHNFQDILYRLYDRNCSPEETKLQKAHVDSLTDKVEVELKHLIKKLSWMDRASKKDALQRYRWRGNEVDEQFSDSELEQMYREAPYINWNERVDLFDYFKSTLRYKKLQEFEELQNLPRFYGSLFRTLPSIDQSLGTLDVPFHMVRSYLFSPELPEQIQFGLLGSILAHELTHLFDGLADRFHRVYKSKSFWSNFTKEEFEKNTRCLVDVYSKQEVEVNGPKINGTSTLNENFADLIGVNMAYSAFKNQSGNSLFNTDHLPDQLKSMTDDQLFFFSYANVHCSNTIKPCCPLEMALNNEAPPKYRVNLPLAQSEHFARAFECKVGSKMNPSKRCSFT